jgi:hypothetical protein
VIEEARRSKGAGIGEAERKWFAEKAQLQQKHAAEMAALEAEHARVNALQTTARETRAAKRTATRATIQAERQAIHAELDQILKSATSGVHDIGSGTYDALRMGGTVAKLALNYAKEGIVSLDEIADRVIADLAARKVPITRDEVVNAIAEASKGKPRTKNELQEAIAGLKHQARSDAGARAQILEYQRQLKTGEYLVESPKARQINERLETLRAKRDILKREVLARIEAQKPRTLAGTARDVLGYAKSSTTSIDVSAPGRQGALLGISHPVMAAKAFKTQIEAMGTEVAAQKAINRIEARPNFQKGVYRRSGLYLAPLDSAVGGGEEIFARNLLPNWTKANPIRASERGFVVYLNQLRADVFDHLAERAGNDPEALKQIANYINVASGRGQFTGARAQQVMGALNEVLFSGRFQGSRVQFLTGQPLLTGKSNVGRALVAKEYVRTLGGLALLYTLARGSGAKIGTDPGSTDYGKWVWGNRRVDPLAGLQQWIVLANRMATGRYTDQAGNTRDLSDPDYQGHGPKNKPEVAIRFLRSKAAPVPSALWDMAARQGELSAGNVGSDYMGKPESVGQLIGKTYLPMSPKQLIEAAVKDGWKPSDFGEILNFFGINSNDYGQDSGVASGPPPARAPRLQDLMPLDLGNSGGGGRTRTHRRSLHR